MNPESPSTLPVTHLTPSLLVVLRLGLTKGYLADLLVLLIKACRSRQVVV